MNWTRYRSVNIDKITLLKEHLHYPSVFFMGPCMYPDNLYLDIHGLISLLTSMFVLIKWVGLNVVGKQDAFSNLITVRCLMLQ